jgi:hypothetical protein
MRTNGGLVIARQVKQRSSHNNRELGILDHIFVAGRIEWNVYVRIVSNQKGSTTTWIFTKPDGLGEEEFEAQLKGFDSEIAGWKSTLENSKS